MRLLLPVLAHLGLCRPLRCRLRVRVLQPVRIALRFLLALSGLPAFARRVRTLALAVPVRSEAVLADVCSAVWARLRASVPSILREGEAHFGTFPRRDEVVATFPRVRIVLARAMLRRGLLCVAAG